MKGVVEEIFVIDKFYREQYMVEGIYVTGEGSAAMERVEEVRTIKGAASRGTATVRGRGSGRVMETFAR